MSANDPSAVLVEDEPQIRRFVRAALEQASWRVYEASNARQGLVECGTRRPELAIVDLGLPDGDGIDLIRELRSWSAVPIIVLSARSDEAQKIAALDAGADDYLTKPFGLGELLARVRAATRRRAGGNDDESVVHFGDIAIDLVARTVTRAGAPVHLTPTEYRLLTVLAAHINKALTQRFLLKEVWGPSHVESAHYLRVFMANLRAKLEAVPAQSGPPADGDRRRLSTRRRRRRQPSMNPRISALTRSGCSCAIQCDPSGMRCSSRSLQTSSRPSTRPVVSARSVSPQITRVGTSTRQSAGSGSSRADSPFDGGFSGVAR